MNSQLRFICVRVCAFAISTSIVQPALAEEAVAAPPTVASTPTSGAESKTRADRAMDQGRYEEALSAYRDAFAIEPSPALLYNMGRAQEKLGRYAEALTTLEAFSAAATPELKARVPRLEGLMKDLRARIARLTIRANVAGARVYIANEPIGTAPFASPVSVMPGTTELQVRADGYSLYAREVALDAGSNVVLDVVLTPAAGASNTSGESSSGPVTKQWWFWTGVGLVVAGGAAVTIAMLTPRSAPQGDIQPGQVTAPLMRF